MPSRSVRAVASCGLLPSLIETSASATGAPFAFTRAVILGAGATVIGGGGWVGRSVGATVAITGGRVAARSGSLLYEHTSATTTQSAWEPIRRHMSATRARTRVIVQRMCPV